MKVLVTGGGGFLGTEIVEMLRARGDEVTTLGRGEYPHIEATGARMVRGDVGDKAAVIRAARACEAIIHTAAAHGIWGRRADFVRTNVVGTRNVIETCRELGISKLVHTSSPSVAYDARGARGENEQTARARRYLTHYPATKAEAERIALAAGDADLAVCALRPHLIWGPRDNQLIPRLLAKARAGKLWIVGKGDNPVDCTYISDAARAHLQALDLLEPGAACAGKAYFLSQGETITTGELINRILKAAGLPPCERTLNKSVAYGAGALLELLYKLTARKTEPPMTRFLAVQLSVPHWFDISAAKRDLGYSPQVSIDEGMEHLAAWLGSLAQRRRLHGE